MKMSFELDDYHLIAFGVNFHDRELRIPWNTGNLTSLSEEILAKLPTTKRVIIFALACI